MSNKVLTQDERALKFFFGEADKTEFKLVKRGAKVVALSELPEINAFSLIDVQLKNGEKWTLSRDSDTGEITIGHNVSMLDGQTAFGEVKNGVDITLTPAVISEPVINMAVAEHHVNRIREELSGVVAGFCRIGYEFIQVRDGKLYRAYNYDNLIDFGKSFFNLKRASIFNYINVCERFSQPDENGKPTAVLSPVFSDYSFSQLTEMMRLPAEKAVNVTPSMSCSEIRALKSADDSEPKSRDGYNDDIVPDYSTDVVNLWCRKIDEKGVKEITKLLREHIGRVVTIEVEIPMHNGEVVPAGAEDIPAAV